MNKNKKCLDLLRICGKFNPKDYAEYHLKVICGTEIDLTELIQFYTKFYNMNELLKVLSHILYTFQANKLPIEEAEYIIDSLYERLKEMEGYIDNHTLGNLAFKIMDNLVSHEACTYESHEELKEYLLRYSVLFTEIGNEVRTKSEIYTIEKRYGGKNYYMYMQDSKGNVILDMEDSVKTIEVYENGIIAHKYYKNRRMVHERKKEGKFILWVSV